MSAEKKRWPTWAYVLVVTLVTILALFLLQVISTTGPQVVGH